MTKKTKVKPQEGVNLTPQRLDDESFEDYQKRRAYNTKWTKWKLRGNIVWISKRLIFKKHEDGTVDKTPVGSQLVQGQFITKRDAKYSDYGQLLN